VTHSPDGSAADRRGGAGGCGSGGPGSGAGRQRWRMAARVLPVAVDAERAYLALHGAMGTAFWLDSSRVAAGLSRWSFLGDSSGPYAEVLTYRVGAGSVAVRRGAVQSTEPGTVFDVLERRLAATVVEPVRAPAVPFELAGGYVGYFGYELKADCGAAAAYRAGPPDAVWVRPDRLVAVDHLEGRTWLVALAPPGAEPDAGWLDRTAAALAALPAGPLPEPPRPAPLAAAPLPALLRRGRDRYLADIAECERQLLAGESYEICLTDAVELAAPADPVGTYRWLRRRNPAPYAALFRHGRLLVAGSSPERFLRIGADRWAESRPIKGTAPRGADPASDAALRQGLVADAKTRAENVMIVDLLRNDLGRICEIGSVSVPRLLATETYTNLHQLVSTVRGRLRTDVSAVGAVRAAFPGGSMTGAPKHSTMRILDGLETAARGAYAGALGWLGPGDTADLSIVIRTLVGWGDRASVGAGGAIVLGSDPEQEYAEMLLKAAAPLQGLVPGLGAGPEAAVPGMSVPAGRPVRTAGDR
jgi:para-aminobenzoate synthetase